MKGCPLLCFAPPPLPAPPLPLLWHGFGSGAADDLAPHKRSLVFYGVKTRSLVGIQKSNGHNLPSARGALLPQGSKALDIGHLRQQKVAPPFLLSWTSFLSAPLGR